MKYCEIKPKHESLMAFYSRLATKTETTINVGKIMNLCYLVTINGEIYTCISGKIPHHGRKFVDLSLIHDKFKGRVNLHFFPPVNKGGA